MNTGFDQIKIILVDIEEDYMNNTIVFGKKITTYNFYYETLELFFNLYKYNKEEAPIFDMRKTSYISPAAVPVVLSFGDYLRKLYKKTVPLLLNEESDLLNFLICSRFLDIGKRLEIFDYNKDYLNKWSYKKIRDLHKVSFTNVRYSDADEISDFIQRRNYIYDCLYDRSKAIYERILSDTNQLPENIIDATLGSIAEIETNAIIHSKSYSFTYVASDKYGTIISIADSGIGFAKSLEQKKQNMIFLNKHSSWHSKFHNFLIIMDTLNYSYEKHLSDDREDLWTLRTNVVNNNGVFKIQYANTQVIFSYSRCKNCIKNNDKTDISACLNCLYESYDNDSYSPIKISNIAYQGVRIEVSINRGE